MINTERIPREVFVVGASAGGVPVLMSLLGRVPADLPAAIAIVLHRSPYVESQLPLVLGRRARLPVLEPEDAQPVEHGAVYVACRDQHLLVADGVLRLSRGPREHMTRPAINPLFRSAAAAYGPRVVGMLLSGMGVDGVSGLLAIKAAGGLSLVQRPEEAPFPRMPRTAIAEDDVDAALTTEELADAVPLLARGLPVARGRRAVAS